MTSATVAIIVLAGCTAVDAAPPPARSLKADSSPSVADLSEAVRSGERTAEDIVSAHLQTISDKEDAVNAFTMLNPSALTQARELDDRIARGESVGSLAGVPFAVKDNMDVAGFPTMAGSAALANNYPSSTAPVVQRLLDEDAILLGKTNMSELAASYGRLGYSSAGGLTLNPANLARDASGSSSGSAAAVAAGMVAFALGTDTSGSVRGPASVTGTVGLRPTTGLIPRTGIVPLALSFDTVGVITSHVDDQKRILTLAQGPDAGDPLSVAAPPPSDDAEGERRIGIVDAFLGGDDDVDAAVRDAIDALDSKGITAERIDAPPSFLDLWATVLGPVGDAEFATQFEAYLADAPEGAIRTLPQLLAFYRSEGPAASAHPINPERLAGLQRAQEARDTLDSPAIEAAIASTMPALRAEVERILEDRELDALVFPTLSCVASPRWDVPDPSYSCDSPDPYTAAYLASAAGLPEVTVPIGTDAHRMPIGLSLLGPPFSESRLLTLAARVEAE